MWGLEGVGYVRFAGLEKNSEIQLALWDWIEMWLVWGFAQWASE